MTGERTKEDASSVVADAASTSSAARKSRPLRRKTSHSVIERRRREKINEGLVHLQRMIPACREELRALLFAKAQADKRVVARRRSEEEIRVDVEQTLEEKIGSTMVLEKLCIISHTVDYVEQLQQTLNAYEAKYGSTLDVARPASFADTAHAKAHLEDGLEEAGSGSTDEAEERKSSESPGEGNEIPCPSATDCSSVTCRAKCQRHWGSNAPLDLSKASGQKRTNSTKVVDRHSSATKRAAEEDTSLSRPSRTLRNKRRKNYKEDDEEEAAGTAGAAIGEDDILDDEEGEEEDEGDDDGNESDLALDDWHESRRSPTAMYAAYPYHHRSHAHGRSRNEPNLPPSTGHRRLPPLPSLPRLPPLPSIERLPSSLYTSTEHKGESGRKTLERGAQRQDCADCDTAFTTRMVGPLPPRSRSPSDQLLARPYGLDVLARVSGATTGSKKEKKEQRSCL